jgi:transposase
VAQARAAWLTDKEAGVGGISPERLVCLDECGVLTNMACLHGRAPRGQRARGVAPAGRWERLTVLGALGMDGIVAAMSVEAATGEAVFLAFLDEVLLPKLQTARPDAVLLMDNLAAHKTPAVRALLDASGFSYRYLPSYSPDLNPIEPSWAKIKGKLRQAAARTADALHKALGPALEAITAKDACGYFRNSGYSVAGPTRKPL